MMRIRRTITTVLASGGIVAGSLWAATPALAAADCPDVGAWGALCLYEDKDWKTNSSTVGWSELASGTRVRFYEGHTSELNYNGFTKKAQDNASSLKNGSENNYAYFYIDAECQGTRLSVPPDGSDSDLGGSNFNDELSSMRRSGYYNECKAD